jgi:hypothetical protein
VKKQDQFGGGGVSLDRRNREDCFPVQDMGAMVDEQGCVVPAEVDRAK